MRATAIACVIVAWLMFLTSFAFPATRDAMGWEVMIIAWMLTAWAAFLGLMAIGSLLLTAAENRARWMLLTSPAPETELQFLLKNRMIKAPGADDTAAGAGDDKEGPS